MPFRSIPRRFQDWARIQPDAPAYVEKRAGTWEPTDWKTFVSEVRAAARALMAMGIEPGSTVAIMGFNCPSWTITDLAAMMSGAVPVGVYTNSSPDQAAYVIDHARARVAVVDGHDACKKIHTVRNRIPGLEHVVFMRGIDPGGAPDALSWDDFLARGASVTDSDLDARLDGIAPHDLGALIYTSGTTGNPKGSMLSHGALAAATDMGIELLPDPHIGARLLSYLPMAHAAERALSVLGPAAYGYTVYYAESVEALVQNLREVEPDLFLGVPRVWEKMAVAMSERLRTLHGVRKHLVRWARKAALQVHELRCQGVEPRGRLRRRYQRARSLVLDRIRSTVGLGRSRVLLSGAAPIAEDVLRFLASMDLPVREVYGQTEVCGPTSNNRPGETRWGSVGRPFRGCEVAVADDGEVLVRGPHLFSGYFRDPEATAAVLHDGWLHSGDLGHIDDDGYLFITGRKKDIIITSGGKNIAPRNIEEALRESPLVQDAVVVGDNRKYLGALVTVPHGVPGGDEAPARGQEASVPGTWNELLRDIWEHVEAVNARVARVEQVRRIVVLPISFGVESGELTPTLKTRRAAIHGKYAREIQLLYDGTPLEGTGIVLAPGDSETASGIQSATGERHG